MEKICDECIYYKDEFSGNFIGCYYPENVETQRMGFGPGTKVNFENRHFPIKRINEILENGKCKWFESKKR